VWAGGGLRKRLSPFSSCCGGGTLEENGYTKNNRLRCAACVSVAPPALHTSCSPPATPSSNCRKKVSGDPRRRRRIRETQSSEWVDRRSCFAVFVVSLWCSSFFSPPFISSVFFLLLSFFPPRHESSVDFAHHRMCLTLWWPFSGKRLRCVGRRVKCPCSFFASTQRSFLLFSSPFPTFHPSQNSPPAAPCP
jgi:hypothetical protein